MEKDRGKHEEQLERKKPRWRCVTERTCANKVVRAFHFGDGWNVDEARANVRELLNTPGGQDYAPKARVIAIGIVEKKW